MAWIALDCGLFEHEKFARLPTDHARLGWIATLLAAKRQPRPGRFANDDHLRLVLGRFARWVPAYFEAELLETTADGIVIHDWDRYQRDPTNAERQERYRSRHGAVTSLVTDGLPRARGRALSLSPVVVSVSSTGATEEPPPTRARGNGAADDETAVFAYIAQHGAAIREDSGLGRRLIGLIERRSAPRVLETCWDMAKAGKLSDRQWVLGLENRLEPIADGKEAAKAERAAEVERQSRRGFEDTQRYLRNLRGEA